MANPSSFWTQANALLRKNLTSQKRNVKTNIRLVLFPVILCVLLSLLQSFIDSATQQQAKNTTEEQCDGCVCAYDRTIGATCPASEKLCGPQYLESGESDTCPIPNPPEWPPLLQIPFYRAQRDKSCIVNDTCPVTMLFTANNQSFARMLFGNMFPGALSINESDIMASLAAMVLGTKATMEPSIFVDPAFSFSSNMSIYYLQQDRCTENSSFSFDFSRGASKYNLTQDQEVRCIQGLSLWRNSSSDINDELYRAYERGNTEEQINEIAAAFDFLNSNKDIFNISIWYNSTLKYTDDDGSGPFKMMRVPRSVNMISNAYLQFLLGSGTKMLFEFLKEMPKSETTIRIDITSVLGGLFFTWVILQLFPVSAKISE